LVDIEGRNSNGHCNPAVNDKTGRVQAALVVEDMENLKVIIKPVSAWNTLELNVNYLKNSRVAHAIHFVRADITVRLAVKFFCQRFKRVVAHNHYRGDLAIVGWRRTMEKKLSFINVWHFLSFLYSHIQFVLAVVVTAIQTIRNSVAIPQAHSVDATPELSLVARFGRWAVLLVLALQRNKRNKSNAKKTPLFI
jgi:hypothetical protein